MSLYRGAGGASDATDDSTVNAVAGYASAAASSASAAATSATEASNSATASASSASSAATSASSVATNATNAANSAALAGNYATFANIYRGSAASSAATASTKAGEASTSASNAATSASTASTQATNAANSATTAATSAADAATSASNAASSASSALAIYGNTTAMNNAVAAAATSASNASTSAANANDSKVLAEAAVAGASSYASSAQSSANSAATSASSALAIYGNTSAMNQAVQTATTSAATAVSSASSATTSATNAAASATSASSSATSAAASAAAASAVVLGNEPVRPTVRPSLLLDFANTKQLDPRITFTRASTATYYDGKTTAMAEQNLLTYSQDFDNAVWTKFGCTVTANGTTAPDGTTTADALVESVGGTFHYLDFSNSALVASGTTVTSSVYLKVNGRTWAQVNLGTGQSAYFDLTNGVVGTTTGTLLGTAITSVGNGWYRCSVTAATATATGRLQVYAASANGTLNYSGDGTSGLFVWGAQFEARSSVTAYTATTSAPITNYIPALQTAASGVARFDNNPTTGESLGLLIEEQRTNLVTYSSAFDNAAWTKDATTVTPVSIVAPDGTVTGNIVSETTAAAGHDIVKIIGSADSIKTLSIYAKAQPTGSKRWLQLYTTGSNAYANFDVTGSGSVSASNLANATITSVGNGWFRCTMTPTDLNNYNFVAVLCNSATFPRGGSYTGDGYSGLFLWGAQLEAGAFATSYIPTTSAQVTRSADAASMTGTNFSSWYRADAGTLYSEAYVSPNSGVCYGVTISDNTSSNAINLGQYNGRNNLGYIKTSGVDQAILSSNATQATGSYLKQAMAFAYNDAADSPNGAAVATDTSVVLPSVNRLDIGLWAGSTPATLNGTIKKLAYYPVRVTNAQLQGMTAV